MADINFQGVMDTLKDEVVNLALATFKDYKTQAKADALQLLNDMKENLRSWTLQLAQGKLSKADFEFLVLGQKELVEMNALRQAGMALIKADEFKNSLFNLITNTITGLI